MNAMRITVIMALLALWATRSYGQTTNLLILNSTVGDDRGPIITWQSESNAIYRIEYADTVVNTNTQWKQLYVDYPSHGTNTFWMDAGNNTADPQIPHPKRVTSRFYRVVKTGTNTAAAPFVQITSPSNDTVLSGEVTVSVIATTSLAYASIKLYVDGQEMSPSDDGTNFVINTSEWANGPHILFATAKAASKLEGNSHDSTPVNYGRAVSAYVPVIFDNYVSQLYFSEAFFEPSLGQTQQVTAVFPGYSSWTLQVLNVSSNAVRTATGEGYTMQFDWDGNGDGGTNLPNGVYYYIVTATQATAPEQGGGGTNSPPPSPSGSMQAPEGSGDAWFPMSPTEARQYGWDYYFVLPPPMPPVKIDGKWYPYEEVYPPLPIFQIPVKAKPEKQATASQYGTFSANAAGAGSAKGPMRPPTQPVKGAVASFGVAYQQYSPGGIGVSVPSSGLPAPLNKISIEGSTANFALPLLNSKPVAENFASAMYSAGWKAGFTKADNMIHAQDIRKTSAGGNNIFGTVNLGLLVTHGFYGTSVDYTSQAQQTYQTYIPFLNNGVNDWLRLSECSFGSTNLRWMAIFACNILRDDNYQSMYNQQVLPINPNLHLLCSARSVIYGAPEGLQLWGKYMTFGQNRVAGPNTIKDAWFLGLRKAYLNPQYAVPAGSVITMRVAGWPNCFGDKLSAYVAPGTSNPANITFEDQQVYP